MFEVIWNGRDELTDSLDRDYAAMRGEGWDLIYEPPSPLTTPWYEVIVNAPDEFIQPPRESRGRSARERAQIHAERNEIARLMILDREWTTRVLVKGTGR